MERCSHDVDRSNYYHHPHRIPFWVFSKLTPLGEYMAFVYNCVWMVVHDRNSFAPIVLRQDHNGQDSFSRCVIKILEKIS